MGMLPKLNRLVRYFKPVKSPQQPCRVPATPSSAFFHRRNGRFDLFVSGCLLSATQRLYARTPVHMYVHKHHGGRTNVRTEGQTYKASAGRSDDPINVIDRPTTSRDGKNNDDGRRKKERRKERACLE